MLLLLLLLLLLSLWSFKVMNDSLGANVSTLSSVFRDWAKTLASVLICISAISGAFLYSFSMLFFSSVL